MANRSLGGLIISALVGISGPRTNSKSSSVVAEGLSNKCTQAETTSRMLCGGISVAIPTAMPVAPLSSTLGTREGSTSGSFNVPSKLLPQSTVP